MKAFFATAAAAWLACSGIAATSAQAQTYPNRPITLIVPFGAGSGTDSVSRIVAQHLSIALKQNVIVDNRHLAHPDIRKGPRG